MLRALAEEEGQPASVFVRTVIRRMYVARFGDLIRPAKKAAKKTGKKGSVKR